MNSLYFKRTNSADPDFRRLVPMLDAELRGQYGDMMDTYDQHNVIERIDTVIVAYISDLPVGCGCFKPFDKWAVEIKRMFVHPQYRGQGISKQILTGLENWAHELSYTHTVLETGSKQTEALGLYKKAGYIGVAAYGPYVDMPDSICFKKRLT